MSKHAAQLIAKAVEFKIPLSWGHIAGKWWGPKDVRPIVSVHGWQDNAGTFDRLIPLLPKKFSYLAIDLPGHGYSSRLAHGQIYAEVHFTYILTIIMDYFKWDKISLMGHSMGGISSFLFATIFGHKIDLLLCIDTFKPYSCHSGGEQIDLLEKSMAGNLIADKRNQEQTEPPTYRYDEIIDLYARGTYRSIEREYSSHIIDRGTSPSANDPNRFYFTRDSRLKYIQEAIYAQETCLAMAQRIIIPFCFIKATAKVDMRFSEEANIYEAIDVLRDNPLFEYHLVSGNHFLHLNNPEKISGIITEFLLKHYQEQHLNKL